MQNPRILYVSNNSRFFISHRAPHALAMKELGSDVWVAAPDVGGASIIRGMGLRYVPISLARSSVNPLRDLWTLASLIRVYATVRPDIVDHHTVKPVIYGSIAARMMRYTAVVNVLGGLGHSFTTPDRATSTRRIMEGLFRVALSHPRSLTVFQNEVDRAQFIGKSLVKSERARMIPGSGVDCHEFSSEHVEPGTPIVMLVGRMLWDKGIGEFVAAANLLRERNVDARFVLVGPADIENPAGIAPGALERLVLDSAVEWWGEQTDMPTTYEKAAIVVLPSYREGLSKTLVEAACCRRPIVTSDVPGCRDVVEHGSTGFVVPSRDAESLAAAIEKLIHDPIMRVEFGRAGRELAVSRFELGMVIDDTQRLYRELLEPAASTIKH